jgi:hypothetical protein
VTFSEGRGSFVGATAFFLLARPKKNETCRINTQKEAPMPKNLFLLREAAKRIGVRPHQLDYAILSGFIPTPALRLGTMRVWTEADLQTAKRYFANKQKSTKEAHE